MKSVVKKIPIILLTIAAVSIVGLFWRENQLKVDAANKSLLKQQEQKEISTLKAQNISPESQTKEVELKAESPLCQMTKQELLTKALAKGASYDDLREIAGIYELVCLGETDIEVSKSSPAPELVEQPQERTLIFTTPVPNISFQDEWERKRKEECQEDINEYNVCMSEYNVKMAEYNSCLTRELEDKDSFDFCSKPVKSCYKPYCM